MTLKAASGRESVQNGALFVSETGFPLLECAECSPILGAQSFVTQGPAPSPKHRPELLAAPPSRTVTLDRHPKDKREGAVKQAEEAQFVDLIACERDCRSCSYAAALDCDGNCGVCNHNSYCPCVNPVVARSKTALRLIELRPILLQDLQVRG